VGGRAVARLSPAGQVTDPHDFRPAIPDSRPRGCPPRLHVAPPTSDARLAVLVIAFGLPFIAIGGFLFFGPVQEALLAPRHLRYALTSRAAYIFRSTLSQKLEVYPITATTSLELEKGKGADSVWFHARLEKGPDGPSTAHVGFRNIADGERVFQLIRGIQESDTA
jgi:hypothetical protein